VAKRFEPDEQQRQAIEHVHGPMLVIAGAGTGKTTVLIRRVARLIREGHAHPSEILALTYTLNSAADMRIRLEHDMQEVDLSGLKVSTFHEYCNGILHRQKKNFGLVEDVDLWIFLARRLRELELKHFVKAADVSKFLFDLLEFMRRCGDELVGPAQYAKYVEELEAGGLALPRVAKTKEPLPREEILSRCREISRAFTKVDQMLAERNLGTFGHMITRAYALLSSDLTLLAQEQKHARFILFDEFQDANVSQVKILRLLAGDAKNVFAVGDPDQGIYRFRGASNAAFGLFQMHFPQTAMVRLETNRRSTTAILKCAHALIAENPESVQRRTPLTSARDEENARAGREPKNEPVTFVPAVKETECGDIVAEIREMQRKHHLRWSDFAVLYRSHGHRGEIIEELAEQGIPFAIENMDVMDTPAVRDLLACLRVVIQPNDTASLLRVAALPQFSIKGEQLRAALRALPRDAGLPNPKELLSKVDGGGSVVKAIERAREKVVRLNLKSAAALQVTGREFDLDLTATPVTALLNFVSAWEKKATTETGEAGELLEYLEYFREAGGSVNLPSNTDADAVRIMTAHSAKGLEFDHVFILRAASPSFPDTYKEALFEFPRSLRDSASVDEYEDKDLFLQEERRLFYVAMTRARDRLTIYAKPGIGRDKTPSGYMRELLGNKRLKSFLQERPPHPFQADMFAEAEVEPAGSRAAEWLNLPPAVDLGLRVSASSVARYKICPLQFKLERDWRLPTEPSGPLQYGAAVHRVLLAYYQAIQAERPMTEQALLELFKAELASAGLQDAYQHELYEQQGLRQLTEFFAASQSAPMPEVLHTEESFEVNLGNTVVTGRIDRMDRASDGSVTITDYKTGRPQSQEDADDSLQLSIYALAARERWGYEARRLVLYNLAGNEAVVTHRGATDIELARKKVLETAANISAGRFGPKPGFQCRFCAYKNLCPATEKKFYDVKLNALSISEN
jgi:superfamily I DNA/RNA helicase/RecB family exonuclease